MATPKAGVTHHMTLSDGTTTLGLMIAPKKGKFPRSLRDEQPLAPRIVTGGEYTESDISAPFRLHNTEEDWRGGIGGQWHRLDLTTLATAIKMDGSVKGLLRPARHTYASTVDNNPTEYAPSGFATTNNVPWAFMGRYPYSWDFGNVRWARGTAPVDSARLFRNAVHVNGVAFVPSWADDSGFTSDMPTTYLHKTLSASSWTLVNGVGTTSLDAFKYFARTRTAGAADKLWGANCVHWATVSPVPETTPLIDTVATIPQVSSASSLTKSFTVANQENRCLIVGINCYSAGGTPAAPTGVTYNGVAMTSVRDQTQGNVTISVWRLVAPTVGTANIVATFAGTHSLLGGSAYSLYNVHQTTPITNSQGAIILSDTSLSNAVPSADNELGVDFIGIYISPTGLTVGAGQTSRAGSSGGTLVEGSSMEESTGATVTLSWSWTGSSNAADVGLSVQGVATSHSSTITRIPVTGTPSATFTAGDVLRNESEYWVVSSVNDANFASYGHGNLVVVRGARGSLAASHNWGNTLYTGTHNAHHIHSTTDGTTLASWATATAIGDSGAPIVGLVANDVDLYVLKTDGVYKPNSDGSVSTIINAGATTSADNYRNAYLFNGVLLLPLDGGGLQALDLDTLVVTDVSLSLAMPEQTQFHGQIVAMESSVDTLYIMVHDATNLKYHVLKSLIGDSNTDFHWHHLSSVTYVTGTDDNHEALMLCSATSGSNRLHRLQIGAESTGSNLLPRYFAHDALDDTPGFTSDTDAVAYTVRLDANAPDEYKTWASIQFTTNNLNVSFRVFTVSYRLDGGSWLTTLTDASGNADGVVATSPSETMTFPASTRAKVLELKLVPSASAVGTTIAELVRFRVEFQIAPSLTRSSVIETYHADGQRLLLGVGGNPKGDRTQMETWMTANQELAWDDGVSGATRQVEIVPGTLRVDVVSTEAYRRPEYVISCMLATV